MSFQRKRTNQQNETDKKALLVHHQVMKEVIQPINQSLFIPPSRRIAIQTPSLRSAIKKRLAFPAASNPV